MRDGFSQDKPWLAAPDTCRQLCILAESKKTRRVFQGRHKWFPGTVRDPRTGEYYDTESAWSYIHELLASGLAEVETTVLDLPPGKKAYVFYGRCFDDQPIYIKLQFGHGAVFGRSFHISDRMGENNDRD